jgi:hypothetical protein
VFTLLGDLTREIGNIDDNLHRRRRDHDRWALTIEDWKVAHKSVGQKILTGNGQVDARRWSASR